MSKVNREWEKKFDFFSAKAIYKSNTERVWTASPSEVKDFIREVISQTRNDLLREIMEEMPKKIEEVDEDKHCWDCGQEDYLSGFNTCHDQVNTLLERKLSTVKKI